MNPLLFIRFAAAACSGGSFFGFPTWYEYLPKATGTCNPALNSIMDIWLIVAAGIDILLHLAALVAVGFIIYGGFQFIISQGDPAKNAQARGTVINALAGLGIAIVAAATVGYVAGRIH